MSRGPLVFVSGLTIGDYLLWNWSLNSNHDVVALVSGLTLPPLALVCLWLIVLGLARLVGHLARGQRARSRHRHAVAKRRTARASAAATSAAETGPASTASASSRKIAA